MDLPRPAVAVVLVAAMLVVGALTVPALAATVPDDVEDDLDIDADDVVLSADVAPDGDATVSLEYRIELADDEAEAAFDELADEIADDESVYLDLFADRFEPTVAAAAAATERDMTMTDLAIETDQRFADRQIGVVTFSFTWTAFAALDGPELHIGDALGGLLLTEDMSLLVEWPDGYDLVEASPEPDSERSGAVSWNGPRDFAPDEPRVVVSTDATATTDDWLSLPLLAGAVVLLAAALAAAGWYRRRDDGETVDDTPPPDEALLSNEEQVLRLVRERGGRMKQQEVAEALEWTDAKTSKVVGALRESGELESFRLGRENVLRLPEEDEP